MVRSVAVALVTTVHDGSPALLVCISIMTFDATGVHVLHIQTSIEYPEILADGTN